MCSGTHRSADSSAWHGDVLFHQTVSMLRTEFLLQTNREHRKGVKWGRFGECVGEDGKLILLAALKHYIPVFCALYYVATMYRVSSVAVWDRCSQR